jgi:hypothetical protein
MPTNTAPLHTPLCGRLRRAPRPRCARRGERPEPGKAPGQAGGLAAFSSKFLGWGRFRQSGVISSHPPAGALKGAVRTHIDGRLNY